MESHVRSLVKSLSWRLFGFVFMVAMAWLITGSAKTGMALGVLDFAVKSATFYLHERLWQRIRWGMVARDIEGQGAGI